MRKRNVSIPSLIGEPSPTNWRKTMRRQFLNNVSIPFSSGSLLRRIEEKKDERAEQCVYPLLIGEPSPTRGGKMHSIRVRSVLSPSHRGAFSDGKPISEKRIKAMVSIPFSSGSLLRRSKPCANNSSR